LYNSNLNSRKIQRCERFDFKYR